MVGATSWGSTIAALLARNEHEVRLIVRNDDEARAINDQRQVPRAPALRLDPNVTATADEGAASEVAAVFFVVPSQTVRANARRLHPVLHSDALVVHATKGLERGTAKRVSLMLAEELPHLEPRNICALSGPNLAPEIQRGLPAATVIASTGAEAAERAQQLLHSALFRVYTSDDLCGVELAGSLKNVLALAAGITDGLALGDNAKAGIITRGLAEMIRLGTAAGAQAITFAGLAGIGDVMATCYSPLSRNYRTGLAVGRGTPIAQAISDAGGVVEGVEATAATCVLADQLGADMPIARALRSVTHEGGGPQDAIRALLERDPAREVRRG